MSDETTINERPRRKPWTRFEWQEKKKSIARDIAEVINRHGFDSYLEIPDWILSDLVVSAMFQAANMVRELGEQNPIGVLKVKEQPKGITLEIKSAESASKSGDRIGYLVLDETKDLFQNETIVRFRIEIENRYDEGEKTLAGNEYYLPAVRADK